MTGVPGLDPELLAIMVCPAVSRGATAGARRRARRGADLSDRGPVACGTRFATASPSCWWTRHGWTAERADAELTTDDVDLDDLESVTAADPGAMLDAVASAGDQVRQALVACEESGVAGVRDGGRPRAVVVTGMGGSGVAGHVLQAAAGPECPVPVERVRGWTLPAWVGADDLVIAVSSSGRHGRDDGVHAHGT